MSKLIIIGGGAAGLFAAITAAKKNIDVTVIEHSDIYGKKILSTGNGKCNMTNLDMVSSKYYGDVNFVESVLQKVDPTRLIDIFQDMGLMTRQRDGYVYPYSNQAMTVRKLLLNMCNLLNVNFINNCNVKTISKTDDIFEVVTEEGVYNSDYVLLATGGKSFPKSGSDGSGYKLAKLLGHTTVNTVPALTAVICNEKNLKQIAGVRAKASIVVDDKCGNTYTEQGEVQFTDYGLSGIPVFNLSRIIAYSLKKGKHPVINVDLTPDLSKEELIETIQIQSRQSGTRTILEQISYIINDKLALYILDALGISNDKKLLSIDEQSIELITSYLKKITFNAANIKGFDFAQVTAGGIPTYEINQNTMESKLVKDLYFAGEIIDIDGVCGGYNLHFAWASAYIAAKGMK